jgi:hypothetical protein
MSKKNVAARRAKNSKLPVPRRGDTVVQFDPTKAFDMNAKSEALIEYAQKVRNWEALDTAVDKHIENQSQLVAWWREVVTPRQSSAGGPPGKKASNAERGSTLSKGEAEKLSGFRQQKISKFGRLLEDIPAYTARLRGPSYMVGLDEKKVRGTQGTGEFERYTPEMYVEAAREVLGEIDLDPASNAVAQKTVKAKEFFNEKKNGLKRDWHGRVFLNPPYHYELAPAFVDKLVEELNAGHTTAAIMLTNNCTDTKWFRAAYAVSDAICFTHGRINFTTPSGAEVFPTQGQCFMYFGNDIEKFSRVFAEIGLMFVPYRPPLAHLLDGDGFPAVKTVLKWEQGDDATMAALWKLWKSAA